MKSKEDILGIKINVSSFGGILAKIEHAVSENGKIVITYLTPHIANYCYRNTEFGDMLNQFDLIYADGIGIVIASRLNGGCLRERITLPDYINDLCDFLIKKNMSVYLLGARPSTIDDVARKLKEKHPSLDIAGYHDGYFGYENNNTIEKINKAGPNLLLVGMGLPYQEKWAHRNKDLLDVNAIWICGGLFDIVSNRIRRAPCWMLKNNLEWLYRLYREPRRLWKRYLLGIPVFICRILINLHHNSRHAKGNQ